MQCTHLNKYRGVLLEERNHEPSLRMAMISTIKGGKSNFHMSASNMKPSCNQIKGAKQVSSITHTEWKV